MDVPIATQVRLARQVIPLVKSLYDRPDELQQLYATCEIINESIGDDAVVMQELLDYVKASIDVAKGDEEVRWRDELLETLEEDLVDED